MTQIFVALALIILMWINLKFFSRDIRHPTNLYIVVWTIMMLLGALPLVNYTPVSTTVYSYVLLSTLLFVIAGNIFGSTGHNAQHTSKQIFPSFLPDTTLAVIGFCGLAVAVSYYISRFGLYNIIHDANAVRSSDTGGTGLLGLLIFLPTVIYVIMITQIVIKRKITLVALLYILLVTGYMALLPERTTLIVTIVWSGFSAYAFNPKLQRIDFNFIRKYGVIIGISFIVFLSFFLFVSQRTQKVLYLNNIEYALNLNLGIPKELYDPFIYITGNVPALSSYMGEYAAQIPEIQFNPNQTGIFLRRIGQVFGVSGNSDDIVSANAVFTSIPFLFNTYTWLYAAVADFGVVGGLIFVGVCATLSGMAWQLSRRFTHPLAYFIYGWAATCSIFTIFSNKFFAIYTSYAVLIALLLYILHYATVFVIGSSVRKRDNFTGQRGGGF